MGTVINYYSATTYHIEQLTILLVAKIIMKTVFHLYLFNFELDSKHEYFNCNQ